MFTGTLKFNIDPTGAISEYKIVDLLKQAGLHSLLQRSVKKDEVKKDKKKKSKKDKILPDQPISMLDFEIEENGKNLSSGEKQLICICRAILRQNKIILLDEATANIDLVTEQKIQALIKKEFTECTVITIAHRLQTIIESDKIIVLGEGKVLEYDNP